MEETMKIKEFNSQNLNTIRNEINQALVALGKKYGVKFETTGTLKYDSISFDVKLQCNILNGSGTFETDTEKTFKANFWNYQHRGIQSLTGKPEDYLNKEYFISGEKVIFRGVKPYATKYTFFFSSPNDIHKGRVLTDEAALDILRSKK